MKLGLSVKSISFGLWLLQFFRFLPQHSSFERERRYKVDGKPGVFVCQYNCLDSARLFMRLGFKLFKLYTCE
ncbi:hypothetical protein L1987_01302 [Smallanthus sonchifolius]|uniref:Uncharacterized protein n=1 Tax=Smallanthus sonchifolius TaxID=185202 RepID=A0ACB9K4V1_9ASTR|nr:hypothetical protein L1987_01302 [Smallanthus sonchifolius]